MAVVSTVAQFHQCGLRANDWAHSASMCVSRSQAKNTRFIGELRLQFCSNSSDFFWHERFNSVVTFDCCLSGLPLKAINSFACRMWNVVQPCWQSFPLVSLYRQNDDVHYMTQDEQRRSGKCCTSCRFCWILCQWYDILHKRRIL